MSYKKLQSFTIRGFSFMWCRWIPKNVPCPENFLVAPRYDLNKWRKTSFLINVHFTRVLFYLKPSGLKLEQTRLNSHLCQLNYQTVELGKRQEVSQTNVTLYLYVQQHAWSKIFLVAGVKYFNENFLFEGL